MTKTMVSVHYDDVLQLRLLWSVEEMIVVHYVMKTMVENVILIQ
jgi:hypothetical protein